MRILSWLTSLRRSVSRRFELKRLRERFRTDIDPASPPFSKLLINIAMASPKRYARAIELRNLRLRQLLVDYVEPLLLQTEDQIRASTAAWYDGNELSQGIYKRVFHEDSIGCPHCDPSFCTCRCLYRKYRKELRQAGELDLESIRTLAACVDTRFPSGSTLQNCGPYSQVQDPPPAFWIVYRSQTEDIVINRSRLIASTPEQRLQRYRQLLAFVDDHIRWARLPIWGTNRSLFQR